jgi:SAM-dependent methyltransferase
MNQINLCPVCSSDGLRIFLTRHQVPVHQNFICADREQARAMQRGTLEMAACGRCGFVFNAAFEPELLAYGEQYENSQMFSHGFDEYVNGLVHRIVAECGNRPRHVIEIGCGKGEFLRRLASSPTANISGAGFDPAYRGPESELDGRLTFHREFFRREHMQSSSDIVVCRHVIEHIADPMKFLEAVREALGNARSTRIYFETPCADWILDNGVVWDFFYEHCSLFSRKSLVVAFQQANFEVVSVERVFGDQYLWLEARPTDTSTVPHIDTSETAQKAVEFQTVADRGLAAWRQSLREILKRGPAVVWGAGAKGVTFCNLVDPDGTLLAGVVDINPTKQGGFLPGTGHPILSPEQLADREVVSALVLNPNYREEIAAQLQQLGLATTVVSLM